MFECRELVHDDIPENVHPEVLVNQDVTEARNPLPFDIGPPRSEFGRETLDGLTDHLEVSHDGVDGLVVSGERLPGQTTGVSSDLRDCPRISSRWTLESRGVEGLAEDPLPQPRLDGVLQDKVYPNAEQLLEERLEIHVGVERFLLELDNEIEIALRARGAVSSRSE